MKFLYSFTPGPFGDLEPGTTNENEPPAEKLPALVTSTHINELVADLQTTVDKLESDVQAVIRKQANLREVTEQSAIIVEVSAATSARDFS